VKWTLVESGDARTYVLVADAGDDAVAVLKGFAVEQGLTAASLTGVGAFSGATVGWFDREKKEYRPIEVREQCELLSLLGDIALGPDGSQVHAHVVLGLPDGSVRGGHLLAGQVWPTLEVVMRESPATLRKTSRPELGLALIDVDRTT
jgi:predicted DNA-binding protein with PD1-like motif